MSELFAPQIAEASGTSIIFVGFMIAIISVGIIIFSCKLLKKVCRKEMITIGALNLFWSIFLFLNFRTSNSVDFHPIFLNYSSAHIISFIAGALVILIYLVMLKSLLRVFDRKRMIIAGIFAVTGLIMRIVFPFFTNVYLVLIQRAVIIIPPLLGLLMMIKLIIKKLK